MNAGAMVAIHAATVAAAAAKARTKVLDTFRTHDATAPARARPLVAIGLAGDDAAVGALIEAGVIRGVDSRGRLTILGDSIDRVAGYYLDEAAYIAHRDGSEAGPSRRAVVIAVVCAMLVVVAAIAVVFLAKANR